MASRLAIVVQSDARWCLHLLPPVFLDEEPTRPSYVESDAALVATVSVRRAGHGDRGTIAPVDFVLRQSK